MKLSDIKGRKSLSIIADAMELFCEVREDKAFADMVGEVKKHADDKDAAGMAMAKYLPTLLRNDSYCDKLMSILASAKGCDLAEYEEDGNVLEDIMELFLEDSETLGFLSGTAAKGL